MWLGWGRVSIPPEKNREENSVAFMKDTIRNFKDESSRTLGADFRERGYLEVVAKGVGA